MSITTVNFKDPEETALFIGAMEQAKSPDDYRELVKLAIPSNAGQTNTLLGLGTRLLLSNKFPNMSDEQAGKLFATIMHSYLSQLES